MYYRLEEILNYDFKAGRIKRGLTMGQVTMKTGINKAYVSRLESGEIANPRMLNAIKLIECYEKD